MLYLLTTAKRVSVAALYLQRSDCERHGAHAGIETPCLNVDAFQGICLYLCTIFVCVYDVYIVFGVENCILTWRRTIFDIIHIYSTIFHISMVGDMDCYQHGTFGGVAAGWMV